MNINFNIYNQYIKSGETNNVKRNTAENLRKTADNKIDTLKISSEASVLKECSKSVKNAASEITDSASEERISALRQEIMNGRYFISADKIADAILDRMSD